MNAYVDELLLRLAGNGYQGRIISSQRLPELQNEIEERFN
jgi:hypothetical protein